MPKKFIIAIALGLGAAGLFMISGYELAGGYFGVAGFIGIMGLILGMVGGFLLLVAGAEDNESR